MANGGELNDQLVFKSEPSNSSENWMSSQGVKIISSSSTTAVSTLVQPLASVIVTVYVPAAKSIAVSSVCMGSVLQAKLYGVAVPTTVTDAVPSEFSGVASVVLIVIVGACGLSTVIDSVAVKPLLSVTVRE